MGLMLSGLALKMGLGSQPPLGPRASPDPRRSHCGSPAVPVRLERWWTVEGAEGLGGGWGMGSWQTRGPCSCLFSVASAGVEPWQPTLPPNNNSWRLIALSFSFYLVTGFSPGNSGFQSLSVLTQGP